MKRKIYEITCNGEVVGQKYAWNAARKEIRNLVRVELGRCGATNAERDETEYKRDEWNDYVEGTEVWKLFAGNDPTLHVKKITYQIKKVQ